MAQMSLLPYAATADWVYPSHEELAQQSDLVFLGKCVDIKQIENTDGITRYVAIIRIEAVLQGAANGEVLLRISDPSPISMRSSADVVVEAGQRGLWYLQNAGDGQFTMEQPYRFMDITYFEENIRELLGSSFQP
jgi:hypothetical protein